MSITEGQFGVTDWAWPIVSSGGGGVGPAPSAITHTAEDNGNGTATVTISGGSSGATNVAWTLPTTGGDWTNQGSRVGNGTVIISLTDGRYFVYVRSTLNSQDYSSAPSLLRMGVGSESGLEHSPAHILAVWLWGTGIGTEPEVPPLAWPIYYSIEPDVPDNVITVYDTSGRLDGRIQITGEMVEHPGLMFKVRSATHEAGYAKAHELKTLLDEGLYLDPVNVNGTEYEIHSLTRTGGILVLGRSPYSNRKEFTLNAVVSLRQTS